jgi:hypothetical protein
MTWRVLLSISGLVSAMLVAACSGDGSEAAPEEAAGTAGDSSDDVGSSSGGSRGGSGGAAAGSSGSAGKPSTATGGGGSGSGGSNGSGLGGSGGDESPSGGAPDGSAGDGNEPNGAVSPTCGAGNYDAGDGCMTCPALPSPNATSAIACEDYISALHTGEGELVLALDLPIHEPFAGEVSIDWVSESVPGTAVVAWEYSFPLESFVFYLPIEARYASEFTLSAWPFSDACGFKFNASAFELRWDGVDSWQCGEMP